jgi:hypothetical protein
MDQFDRMSVALAIGGLLLGGSGILFNELITAIGGAVVLVFAGVILLR